MRHRRVALAAGAALALLALAPAAEAQAPICSGRGFAASPGAVLCSGAGAPVTVTATVRTYARLSLDRVFGNPAAGLGIAFGDVDAECVSPAAAGITCVADHASRTATWWGDVAFRVQLAGAGPQRARLTGVRPAAGTIPAGRLLDGAPGAAPTAPYPVTPAAPAALRGSIGNGETTVVRSVGLRVSATDPPGSWSGTTVYSVVLE